MNVETVVMNFWRIAMNSGFVDRHGDMDLKDIILNMSNGDINCFPPKMDFLNNDKVAKIEDTPTNNNGMI